MKLHRVLATCLLLGLGACGSTKANLDQQAAAKTVAQDQAASAELKQCGAQYPSPVAPENAVAKFQCMSTAYHHFSKKLEDADETYFAQNMALAQKYAEGKLSYDEMKSGIAKNFKVLQMSKQTLAYQAAMMQAQAEESAARARTDRAVRGAQRDAARPDMPDAE